MKLKKIDKMKKIEDLHAGKKTVFRISRLHFLQELEEELKVYYLSYTETVDRPYSEQDYQDADSSASGYIQVSVV